MIRRATVLCSFLCGAGVLSAQQLSGMAAGIVTEATLARQAVAQHDQTAAFDHLRQASSLAADIARQSAATSRPLLIPIPTEIATTSTDRPVKNSGPGKVTARRMKNT